MGTNADKVKEVKGFLPRSIKYAQDIDEGFSEALASFYTAVWEDRDNGLSMKEKHLLVFSIACSNNNSESAVKILERLKKFGATRTEITDCMMIAAWTGGIQNFTDFSRQVLKQMDKLEF